MKSCRAFRTGGSPGFHAESDGRPGVSFRRGSQGAWFASETMLRAVA